MTQTADIFLTVNKYNRLPERDTISYFQIKHAMIRFAKLHCAEQARVISEKATVTPIDHEEISEGSFRPIWGVCSDSILNAYPLDLIK